MVTILDISKETGYSKTTVSKALNNYSDVNPNTRRVILETAEKLGYIPNSSAISLATKKSWLIGVVFEEKTGVGITHPFFSEILDKFKKHMEIRGYDLIFISEMIGKDRKLSYYEHCLQRGVDGVIILCTNSENEMISRLIQSEIPSVLIDNQSMETNCVYTNGYKSVYDAVDYLVKKGHKKIGHIAGALKTFVGRDRLRGYQDALKDNGFTYNEQYVFKGSSYSVKEGKTRALELLALQDPPTAVVTASDNLAIGLIHGLEEKGLRIPHDVSVIGFDNNELSRYMRPSLTTINQNKDQIAYEAAELLLKQIDQPGLKPKGVVIEGTLIERDSVASI